MYIIIRKHSDLNKLHALKDKEKILTRFMMNGCSWCEKSQPEWDDMATSMSPQLDEHDAIAEVESQFVDNFRNFMAKHRKPYPPVRGFPSVYIMSQGVASPHQGRDQESFIQLLKQLDMVRNGPKKIKYSPNASRVSFMDNTLSPIVKLREKGPLLLTDDKSKSRSRTRTRSRTPHRSMTKSRSRSRSRSKSSPKTRLSFTVRRRTKKRG